MKKILQNDARLVQGSSHLHHCHNSENCPTGGRNFTDTKRIPLLVLSRLSTRPCPPRSLLLQSKGDRSLMKYLTY